MLKVKGFWRERSVGSTEDGDGGGEAAAGCLL